MASSLLLDTDTNRSSFLKWAHALEGGGPRLRGGDRVASRVSALDQNKVKLEDTVEAPQSADLYGQKLVALGDSQPFTPPATTATPVTIEINDAHHNEPAEKATLDATPLIAAQPPAPADKGIQNNEGLTGKQNDEYHSSTKLSLSVSRFNCEDLPSKLTPTQQKLIRKVQLYDELERATKNDAVESENRGAQPPSTAYTSAFVRNQEADLRPQAGGKPRTLAGGALSQSPVTPTRRQPLTETQGLLVNDKASIPSTASSDRSTSKAALNRVSAEDAFENHSEAGFDAGAAVTPSFDIVRTRPASHLTIPDNRMSSHGIENVTSDAAPVTFSDGTKEVLHKRSSATTAAKTASEPLETMSLISQVGGDSAKVSCPAEEQCYKTPELYLRSVTLKGLPDDCDYTLVQSLLHGVVIENMALVPEKSLAEVRLTMAEDAKKFADAHAHGIKIKYGRRLYKIDVKVSPNETQIGIQLQAYLDCGATRVIQWVDADEDLSLKAMCELAEGRNGGRRVELVIDSYRQGVRTVGFRFASIGDAVAFRSSVLRDPDRKTEDLHFADDPCEIAVAPRTM